MAETTGIEWADATINPWWGCTKVSPACDNCYAAALDKRTGGNNWGARAGRREIKSWRQTAAKLQRGAEKAGKPLRVFCASMADVFESFDGPVLTPGSDAGPRHLDDLRAELWETIEETPNLIWMLLTKRPQSIMAMVPDSWQTAWPDRVWIGTTVESQVWAERRIPELLQVPAKIRFLSCEPLTGPVSLSPYMSAVGSSTAGPFRKWDGTLLNGGRSYGSSVGGQMVTRVPTHEIGWVITGGETGAGSRPADPDWFREIRDDCLDFQVPFHFKQWGDWDERQERVGKKAAGRLLDGRTHDGLPALDAEVAE